MVENFNESSNANMLDELVQEGLEDSRKELSVLRDWVEQDPYNLTFNQLFENFWNSMPYKDKKSSVALEKHLHVDKEVYVDWDRYKDVDISMRKLNQKANVAEYEIVCDYYKNWKRYIDTIYPTIIKGSSGNDSLPANSAASESYVSYRNCLYKDKDRDNEGFSDYYENDPVDKNTIVSLILPMYNIVLNDKAGKQKKNKKNR